MPQVRTPTNGIEYRILYETEHQRPHVHIASGGKDASIALNTLTVLANGGVQDKKLAEAMAWIGRHQGELTIMYENRLKPGAVRKIED